MTQNKTLPAFYLKAMRDNYCPLTRAEETQYINLYKQGDNRVLSKLINSQMKYIVGMARAYADANSPVEDCIQEAVLAFPNAIRDFDPTMGFRFQTFLSPRIRDAIQKYAFQNDIVRMPMNKVKAVEEAKKKLEAKKLDIDPSELAPTQLRRTIAHSIHAPVNESSTATFEDTLTYDDSNNDEELQIIETIQDLIGKMDQTTPHWKMLLMYYGFEGQSYSLEDIARRFNCRKQNVDYHIKKLLNIIRAKHKRSSI